MFPKHLLKFSTTPLVLTLYVVFIYYNLVRAINNLPLYFRQKKITPRNTNIVCTIYMKYILNTFKTKKQYFKQILFIFN